MRSTFWLIGTLLVWAAVAFGDGPKAIITDGNGNPPPESVQAGEALYLSAAQSKAGDKPSSIIWIVKPAARAERTKTFNGGRDLCIPLGTKTTDLVVTQIVALGDEASYAEITIHITGDAPAPPNPPSPPNPPIPPQPPTPPTPPQPSIPSKYGLTQKACDLALAVKYTTNRKAECSAIADCFSAAASIAASLTNKTPEQIVADFVMSVKQTPYLTDAQRANWHDFGTNVALALDDVANLPSTDPRFLPQTREAYIAAMEELSAGCKAAASR